MKKILIVTVFLLFVLSAVFFIHFGPQIRDALSPVVECTQITYGKLDGRTYPTLPEAAVLMDEMGMTYIYIIESTDEYPEMTYKTVRKDVTILYRMDGIAYIQLTDVFTLKQVVLRWEGILEDGQRVCVAG